MSISNAPYFLPSSFVSFTCLDWEEDKRTFFLSHIKAQFYKQQKNAPNYFPPLTEPLAMFTHKANMFLNKDYILYKPSTFCNIQISYYLSYLQQGHRGERTGDVLQCQRHTQHHTKTLLGGKNPNTTHCGGMLYGCARDLFTNE